MSESSTGFHEAAEVLTSATLDLHRALASLREELEAVDWYRQRADACGDEDLRGILMHNMREEIEHACMLLEWLRRRNSDFETRIHAYLYTEGDILAAEVATRQAAASSAAPAEHAPSQPPAPTALRLTIGSLKERS